MNRASVISIWILLMLSMMFFGAAATAQDEIQDKIADQRNAVLYRTAQGFLTSGEARVLQANLDRIKKRYGEAVAERNLKYERQGLLEMLDRNRLMIYQKQHNPVAGIR